jgi:hypothetical protein
MLLPLLSMSPDSVFLKAEGSPSSSEWWERLTLS